MNDHLTDSAATPRRAWLRKLGWGAAIAAALLVVIYFTVTSAMFSKGVILPRVAQALGAELTVTDAVISPFSRVVLRGVKLQAAGEPLLQATEIRARYSLWKILGGTIHVEEAVVEGAVLQVVQRADGTFNFAPILKATASGAPKPPAAISSPPPQILIKSIAVNNSTIRFTQTDAAGRRTEAELTGVNLAVSNLQNGQTARLQLSTDARYERPASTGAALVDRVRAKLIAALEVALAADLQPTGLKGNLRLEASQGQGAFAEVSGLLASFDGDVTPGEIKKFALQFSRGGQALGAITASGPFDARKMEGRVRFAVTGLDRNVLNFAGAPSGLDFGTTRVAADGEVVLTKAGQGVGASGQITASSFSVRKATQTTPPLDLKLAYQVDLDLAAQTARARAFSLSGTKGADAIFSGSLSKPMAISWGTTAAGAVEEAELLLTVTGLNLAEWSAFTGEVAPTGLVELSLTVTAQQSGNKLGLGLTSSIRGLTVKGGGRTIAELGLTASARGTVSDLKRADLGLLDVRLTQSGQPLAGIAGAGLYDAGTQEANFGLSATVELARAAGLAAVSNLNVTAGQLSFAGRVKQAVTQMPGRTNSLHTVDGRLTVTDVSARHAPPGSAPVILDRLATSLDLDLDWKDQRQAVIRKFSGAVQHAGQPAGNLEFTGRFDTVASRGQLTAKVSEINESLLRPALQPALGHLQLQSGVFSLTAEASVDLAASSSIRADVILSRLLLVPPGQGAPAAPLDFRAQVDASASRPATNQLAVTVRKLSADITQGTVSGGKLEGTADFDTKRGGQFALRVTDLNQTALRPFASAALGDRQLMSVSLNATADGRFNPSGASAVKARASVANLVVRDPSRRVPETPLSLGAQLDGEVAGQILTLRQVQLDLPPTPQGSNSLVLSGRVDLSNTNAYQATLRLNAGTLDLTSVYDLLAGAPKDTNAPPLAASPVTTEPAAMKLPLRQSRLDIAIGQLKLRELLVANLAATAQVDASRVQLKPFQLRLNGAPVEAALDLNLGVPGYQYDVALSADRIPMEPLVRSFSTTTAQVKGDLIAKVALRGAGVTGASLRQNLAGQAALSYTNAAIHIELNRITKIVLYPISFFLRMPELLSSPLNYLNTDIHVGKGKIEIRELTVHSDAMIARSPGVIPIAPVLSGSPLNQEIELWLPRQITQRLFLPGAATSGNHLKLPNFVRITGTIGDLKVKEDKLVIAGLLAGGVAGAVGGRAAEVIQGVGGVVQGLGNLFGGGKPAPAAPPAGGTNQVAHPAQPAAPTNKPGLFNPFRLIPKK